MNRGRDRGGRPPSTPSSSQIWRPVSRGSTATPNESSSVSDSGNHNQGLADHGRPEPMEILDLSVDMRRVQLVDRGTEVTEHLEDNVSPFNKNTPSRDDVTASNMSHSSSYSSKSGLSRDFASPGSRSSVDVHAGRGRSGRAPSTLSSGRSWHPIGHRLAATRNEASPVSDSGNPNQELDHHGRPEQREISDISVDIKRVQLVDRDTEHPEDSASPVNRITPSRDDDSTASNTCDSSSYSGKSSLLKDFTSPCSSNSVDVHAEPPSPMDMANSFNLCLSNPGTPGPLKPSLLEVNREKRKQTKQSMEEESRIVLRSGMVHLKKYLSIDDQVKIVKLCHDLGRGPGGFYQPGYRDGATLNLKMMCLGQNWNPNTNNYEKKRQFDGSTPPNIPVEFNQIVERAIRDCHAVIKKNTWEPNVEKALPWMIPDICLVNFYSSSGRLGLHQDRDESKSSLQKGLPVVSFSIGDTAEFLYGDQRDVDKAEKVSLESGDVLVFGGKSRHIFHGVDAIVKDSAPKILLDESKLRPGRLNLTFRQY